ncbi:bacillithiol system redox-active protein YtxJ [Limibacter armeniacum]|uniref:bacillithiol system redox-active protein YtxJ n=1 Tax=Limibacter armeniacum TaxID=466084 RepID=UPI002FE60C53
MQWHNLTTEEQIAQIKEESKAQKVMIFKHSTRCSISSMAKNRLERSWQEGEVSLKPYYLDLISYRNISNRLADEFGVLHESPQVLVIENGSCVYDNSHMGINYNELKTL